MKSHSRRRARALALLALVAGGVATLGVAFSSAGHGTRARRAAPTVSARSSKARRITAAPRSASRLAVGIRVLRLLDTSRTIKLPSGSSEPRAIVTVLRYPAGAPGGGTDLRGAPGARAAGPFPLIVFGHGFAVTPATYSRLLQSWTRAGYVVAAPVFPRENANAPGGPDESDLVNQPADMRFVISRLLAASGAGAGPLAGLIDPARIAVAGQSDGGDTALAVAYDPRFRDPRVHAAVILSGAEMPGVGDFAFVGHGPPLLATQGTADTVNPPTLTSTFFDAASSPKYLLSLLGAEHLPPYTSEQPQLTIVERVTVAFLDGYLKHRPGAPARVVSLGEVPGSAAILARP
jgi:predicted dienelactone hydrolase